MPSIESIGHPLVYKADRPGTTATHDENRIDILVKCRALKGMQKEALVYYGPTDTTWRMVSDEGPYLNGTDLAPFPLAYYTAGMAFSFMAELLKHAQDEGIVIDALTITQDNFYTMEGSALRGDMTGGAKPVEISVDLESDASDDALTRIVWDAEASSMAQAYMRDMLTSRFALALNGTPLAVTRVMASPLALSADPASAFDRSRPLDDTNYTADIITKLEAAARLFNVEGGAGSSLQAEQKRTLHVRGVATLCEDGMKEVRVQLLKPIGSTFRFLSDDAADQGGQERAPSPLTYLSAGIAFCFMTQLGRYAHIVKQELDAYRIVQHNAFHLAAAQAVAEDVDTHVFVDMDAEAEIGQRLVDMGEQTCFLHAAMRSWVPSTFRINGKAIK